MARRVPFTLRRAARCTAGLSLAAAPAAVETSSSGSASSRLHASLVADPPRPRYRIPAAVAGHGRLRTTFSGLIQVARHNLEGTSAIEIAHVSPATASFPTARARRRAAQAPARARAQSSDVRAGPGGRSFERASRRCCTRPDGDDDRRDPRRAPARRPGGGARSSSTSARSIRRRAGRTRTSSPIRRSSRTSLAGARRGARDGSGGSCTKAVPELRSMAPFDVYRGEQVGEGRKSIAFRVEFRSPERTLTDEEAAVREKIVAALGERFGAELEPRARRPGRAVRRGRSAPCPRSAGSARAGSGSSDP